MLHIENGDLLGRRVEVLPVAEDDAALLGAVVPQYYLDRELLPREILLPLPVEDMDTLSALLTDKYNFIIFSKSAFGCRLFL